MQEEFLDIEELKMSARRENRAAAVQYIYMCDISKEPHTPESVSYTHLTLPTTPYV